MWRSALVLLARPAWLMALTWLIFAVVFALSPLDYYREVAASTWAIVAAGVLLFALGALAARAIPILRPRATSGAPPDAAISIAAVVGFLGIVLLAYDKVALSGLDYSQGFAAVRFRRDVEVAAGIDIARSPLLYVGYATFSFSYCATVLFVLVAEEVRRLPAYVAQASVISPVAYALLYGGRAPILLLCVLLIGAALVRVLLGKPLLPRAHWIRAKFLVLCAAFVLYVNYTWEDRRQYSGIGGYASFLETADVYWRLRPKPWFDEAVVDGTLPARTAMDLISSALYLTHSLTTLDKMIEHRDRYTPSLGTYQVGVLSPLIRVVAPASGAIDRMTDDLRATAVFGWFPTAWGAWLMDLGTAGGSVAVFLWGLFAGAVQRSARRTGSQGAQLLLAFALSSVLLSPLNAPFGLANSALIFFAFAVTAWLLRFPLRSLARRRMALTSP